MASKTLPLFLLTISIIISGCGSPQSQIQVKTASAAPEKVRLENKFFNKSMIGQTWVFQNGHGDMTTIEVQLAPAGSNADVVWHFTKDACRAYWNPDDCSSELWFGLKQNPDKTWSSVHQLVICDECIAGHSQGTVDNFLEPGAYMVVPVAPGTTGDTGYHPNWQFDVLTWDWTYNPLSNLTPWRTDSYFDGDQLVSEQWENCPDFCTHEKWWFKEGVGLVRVWQENKDPLTEMIRITESVQP